MVRVRLSRGGGKKRPYYHIVVVDQKAKRDGKCIERIGSYDPNLETEKRISLKHDRLEHWIKLGAQMSDRVRLLQKYSIDPNNLEKRKKIKSSLLERIKQKKLKAKEAEAAPAEDTATEAAPAEDTATEAAPAEDTATEAAPAEDTATEAAPTEDIAAEKDKA
jgi:small subunit ribosomal protein S16